MFEVSPKMMNKVRFLVMLGIFRCVTGDYGTGEGVYVPKYLQQKYGNSLGATYYPEKEPSPVKTVTKTKTGSYSKTAYSGGGYSPYHVKKTGFEGGCTSPPPTPMNSALRCSKYSGCIVDCIPNYKFPNGEERLLVKCNNGQWLPEGVPWDSIPACEPVCLPECQNNGICVAPNQCNCAENFSGPQCQFEQKPCLNYPPMPLNSKRVCRTSSCTVTCMPGHQFPDGTSVANMICKDGNWVPSKNKWASIPDCQATCMPPCLNGGNCLSFNICQCPQDFRGPQCQYRADACNARKLLFNGGYNCSGDADSFSCSLSCPEGIPFEFPPASVYTCTYDNGIFQPFPVPQCVYASNMEVIPSGSYKTFHHQSSSHSMSSDNYLDGQIVFPQQKKRDELVNETNFEAIPLQTYGVQQNQFIVVQEKTPEPGICFTWGGTHYKTFDGRVFSFESDCSHLLVRDAVDGTFSVITQNYQDCRKYPLNCYKIVKLYFQDKEYVLKLTEYGLPQMSYGKKTISIPGRLPGMRIEFSAHFVVITLDTVGAKIKWDGQQLVQVEVKENLWNRTEGLCGKIDGYSENDFEAKDGSTPKSVVTLATSWQIDTVGEMCNSLATEELVCPDSEGKQLLSKNASLFCKTVLEDKRFAECHKVMDTIMLEDTCRSDYCSCDKADPSECACNTINVYVKQCLHKGIKSVAKWRDENLCPMQCGAGKVYMACGPSKGQATCGASSENYEDDGSCVEGCYCPEGTVLHDHQCITKDKCPCKLRGKTFKAGSSVPKGCNTCTCVDGQWVCTEISCGARCAAVGDPHYITFDGRRFDFMGQCSYYLVKNNNFTIEAENVACAGAISQAMNFPISTIAGFPSCTKTVTIKMAGQVIKLKQNHDVVVNGQDITKVPYKIAGIVIRPVSSLFLQAELPNGVDVWWDGFTRVYIDVPPALYGKTMGLCGTFNNNQKDDFLTPENDIEKSVIPFANKWKTSEKCNDIPDKLLQNPCEANIQNKGIAEMHCSKLKSELFKACHFYVDPEPFYHDCLFDMCSCETKVSKCLCSIIASYAQECSRQGIKVDWRDNIRECGVHCPGGQKYQVCGNTCTRTCHDVATRPDCRPQCVEGCNCPEGQALDDHGECIPIGQCSCYYKGLEYPAGYKEIRPASKGPELCTCTNALWHCRPAIPMELGNYPNSDEAKTMCNPADNLEFTTCESVEPITCKNMHSQEMASVDVCHAGCQCKKGYVLDTVQKKCVLPTECPCHHGGRSYAENATVQSDCNTCVCKNGKWQCTDRQCTAECSTWGDSHYKTFDGKVYDYQGQCDYVFAKGFLSLSDSFDVIIQSVPCGSLGVTCSKSIHIKIGAGLHQETFSLTREKPIPSHKLLKRLTVREKGLFVIVEAPDLGFLIHWDKGTRVYVKLDPRWKNKVKGLCGNYNDNELDDFQTPSGGLTEVSANIFGDSWKLQPYCPEALEITNTCEERPDRKVWALKKCGILKSSVFSPCHSEVPVDGYHERCIFDTCACDQGGDCECLCTALAAYAQECNNHGVPIKWRSQKLCPMQCDERCSQYSPCISTCPTETCDNLLVQKQLSKICSEDTCIEGCQTKQCPPDYVYSNSSLSECVPRNSCKVFCMEIDGVKYYEGDLIKEDDCHSCYCSRNQQICKGQPCTTEVPTPAPTVPVTHQNEEKPKCISGWTEWINQDKTYEAIKSGEKFTDREPLPDSLVLNIMKSTVKCPTLKMVDIECRTVHTHIPAKQTGLDAECSLDNGLFCQATEGETCPDFEIRVYCQCENVTATTRTPQPSTTAIIYQPCDPSKQYQEHPTDCHLFYHCAPGLNGTELVEKSCGPDMMYNPQTQVCDWPYSVLSIKPYCGSTTETTVANPPTTTETPAPLCPWGLVYDPCATECKNLCQYYEYTVKKQGLCKNDLICQEGCRDIDRSSICPKGMLRNNNRSCVAPQDCICLSNTGQPVKPGQIIYENGCEVCQCINNFYTCDSSACLTTSKPIVTTTPVVTEILTTTPASVIPLISTNTPPKECSKNDFVDLIQGDVPLADNAFSASSYLSSYLAPKNARFLDRIPEDSGGAWAPEISNKDQYLQIDFGRQEPVYGIKIKGSPLYDEYVTSYYVIYSPDGVSYSYVTDDNKKPQIFRGSFDRNAPAIEMFDVPFEAQILRVNPQTWINGIALRVEIIGCRENLPTISPTVTPMKIKMCEDPLGVSSGMMADTQITVSSELSPEYSKSHLKIDGDGAWQPLINSPTEWIQFDFLEPRNITGLTTKGGPDGWVTAYTLKYSPNEKIWNPILDILSEEKVFPGNFDSLTAHTNNFDMPISARYLKIIPLKWHINIQLRVEPIGCFLPYPTQETPTTEPPPMPCNYCPGVAPLEIELGGCKCEQQLWWDGQQCVSRNQCPCTIGHMTYEVGSVFEKEDCSQCMCKLGGTALCTPKVCPKCEKDLQSVVTITCGCICKPCDEGTILCPTSNICINETAWCNGVKDCPDDETNCEISTQTPTTMPTEAPKVCPKPTCPPGYKPEEKAYSKAEVKPAYASRMFSVYETKTKSSYSVFKMPTKTAYKKPLKKPMKLNEVKEELICPEYTCKLTVPPPPVKNETRCPPVKCPQGFLVDIEKAVHPEKCPRYTCSPPPPPEATCNVTGRTFNTFDYTEYKYDICNHILARDLKNDEWDISIKKNCTLITCFRELTIRHEGNTFILHADLSIEFNGYKYSMEQIKKIGSQVQTFSISQLGNSLLFSSNKYGFWVIWDKNGNVKIGVVSRLAGEVDGLCGYFNNKKEDDKRLPDGKQARTTAEFGDSWATEEKHPICEAKACPIHIQNQAWEMCNKIRDQSFEACSSVMDIDVFVSKCLETACNCIEAAGGNSTAEDKCRCESLQSFVVDCMSCNPDVDLTDWRMQNDCPATCESPLIYHDCYQRRCEPTCETFSDPSVCPKLSNLCFPGCYCPPGLVRKGDECVSPSSCRDCECNLLPHLQYVTYDQNNFTVNGKCVYVMSRDEGKGGQHDFQVLITNAPCRGQESKMCVGKVTILYEGHKVHIMYNLLKNKLKVIIDGEVLTDFTEVAQWAQIKETPSKHIQFTLIKSEIEVSVYFPTLGVSVKAPSHKYGGHLEGLCGDCNKNADNDWLTPFGKIATSEEELGISWLYERLPGGQDPEKCGNKVIEECKEIPIDENPCVQLVDINRFGQCHPLIDPTMFIEWCNKDTCGDQPKKACDSIQAYAIECMNAGFCVDWHSDLCPAEICPPGQVFDSCNRNCHRTCEDVNGNATCSDAPIEGCFCPNKKVLFNGTCIEERQCIVCDAEGHHPGDTWRKDACTNCTCIGSGSVTCETQHCPTIDTICTPGLKAVKIPADKNECCDKFICVPEPTSGPVCEVPKKIPCSEGQVMKVVSKSDGCQQFVCECKPKDECEKIDAQLRLPTEEGYERVVNNSGCCPVVEVVCKPETCPPPKSCPQFYTLKEDSQSEKCCPVYICESPKKKCIFESEYVADTKGGERPRNKYEKQKVLKNVNETWLDGPCRHCKCVETSEDTYSTQCSKTDCPALQSFPDFTDYVLKAKPVLNQCCPEIVRIACKHEGKTYKVGEEWPETTDYCVTSRCISSFPGVEKRTTKMNCNENCEPGWEYLPAEASSQQCCGTCKPVACVVDGQVKKIGEQWTSPDYCMKYTCTNANGSLNIQAEKVHCPEVSLESLKNYAYKRVPIEGECCPKIEATGCRVGNKEYKVGEKWPSPDGDKCKTFTCTMNDVGEINKQESIETCKTDCKIGWKYHESEESCCGECVPYACVVEGVLKMPGENWTSSDKCTTFSCEHLDDQFSVSSQQESCPDVDDCPVENIYVKGCCKYCNAASEPQKQCSPEVMLGTKTIGIIKQMRPPHGLCRNEEMIQGFTECIGSCDSSTYFNSKVGSHESVCACCQAVKYDSISVDLVCEDGYIFKKRVAVPSFCKCKEGCEKRPINKPSYIKTAYNVTPQ